MSILHLVRRSAFETSDFEQCINSLTTTDHVILLDDGCYNIQHPLFNKINVDISVLKTHAQARAIAQIQLLEENKKINLISMDDLVTLTFSYHSVVTWQ